MPKVPKLKKAEGKAAPYPSARPASAGPSTLPTPTPQLSKKERKKLRRSSLNQSVTDSSTPLAEKPQNAGESSKPLALPSSSGRTDSAATTVASDATGASTGEKKKRKKKKKRRESMAEQPTPVVPPTKPAAEPMETEEPALMAYPQPGAKAVESSEDVVARILAKSKKKERKRARIEAQANEAGPSTPAAAAKVPLLKDGRVSKLEKKLEEARKEAEREKELWSKEREEMAAKLKEAEGKLETQTTEVTQKMEEKESELAKSVNTLNILRDAATCGVCLDYFKDPHILTCGHIACKECLTSWFRTSAAFLHPIPDLGDNLVPSTRDVSYRTKMCHVCRVPIFRRPSRMYHFDSILEPLGINPQIPSLSQDTRDKVDPWRNIFPREHDSYRVRDADDNIDRCPECNGEIDEDYCNGCDIEFSESEGEADMLSEGSEGGEGHGDGSGSDDDDGDESDEGLVPGMPGLNAAAILDEAGRRHREEVAAEARVDRQIRAEARRIADRANLMDLEAGSDGEEDNEEEDPWDGEGVWSAHDDEEESNDEVVMMAPRDPLLRDAYSDEEEEEEEEEMYDSSFIDDDEEEEEEVVEGESGVASGEGEDSLEIGGKGSDAEDLDIEGIREKRLARFGAPAEPNRSESPVLIRAPTSSGRRRVVDSDSE